MISIEHFISMQTAIDTSTNNEDKIESYRRLIITMKAQHRLMEHLNKVMSSRDKIAHLITLGLLIERAEVYLRDTKISILLAK